MLFSQSIALLRNHHNIHIPVTMTSNAQALARGFDNVISIDFTDNSFMSNNTTRGSVFILDNINANNNYHGHTLGRLTFTRSSNATYVNSTGFITNAVANELRFDYDPLTLDNLGVVINAVGSTNICLQSQNTNATWTKNGLNSSNTAALLAPDNTMTMNELIEDSSNAVHGISQTITYSTNNVPYCISCFVKQSTRGFVLILFPSSRFGTTSAQLNFSNGHIVTQGTVLTGTKQYANGVYRFWASANTTSNGTGATEFRARNVTGSSVYQGVNNQSAMYIWGMQVEQNYTPSAYMPTTTANTSRSAESLYINTANMAFTEPAGTWFVEFSRDNIYANSQLIARFYDLTSNNRIDMVSGSSVPPQMRSADIVVNSVSVASVYANSGNTVAYTYYKDAATWEQDSVAGYFSNGTLAVDTSANMVPNGTITRLIFGSSLKTGHIKKFLYYNRKSSNTELQRLIDG